MAMKEHLNGIRVIKYPTKVCPFCGENKTVWDYFGTFQAFRKGLDVGTRTVECYTCGAHWELEKGYTEHR